MKVIFLDIDGVLNSRDDAFSRRLSKYSTHDSKNCQLFDERCCRWLKHIINETQAKIVISSTWRLKGLEFMKKLWEERGLAGEIIGITSNTGEQRGYQIQSWLEENDYVSNYVIIDDDPDMLFEQQLNFVKCVGKIGLDYETATQAIKTLNGKII